MKETSEENNKTKDSARTDEETAKQNVAQILTSPLFAF